MNFKPVFCLMAAVALSLITAEARAGAIQYYNVDKVTLPNGPIQLTDANETPIAGGYVLTGNATNTSLQTYDNVLFLNEWMFDAGTAFSYIGSNTWSSADGNAMVVPPQAGLGTLAANDVSPLPFLWASTVFPSDPPGVVNPGDVLPYISIGTLGPGASVPFSETIQTSSPYLFDFTSSFVSTTPVPEPSTLILAGLGAIGLIAVRRRRKRLIVSQG